MKEPTNQAYDMAKSEKAAGGEELKDLGLQEMIIEL
jgi:hypothetical protein